MVSMKRQTKSKYPPVKDSDKVCYLLLHLAVPSIFTPSLTKHLSIAKKAANSLGIKLSTITIDIENNRDTKPIRYLFRFPYYLRDDEFASRFAETILIIASITFGVFLDDKDNVSTFRIPMELIKNRKSVYLEELVQIEEARLWEDRITAFSPESLIGSTAQFPNDAIEMAWNLAPLLLKDNRYHRAFRFLKTSQENFFVWPGEIEDVIDKAQITARNSFEQSRFENALQDSFKAVEAILGDPPKNDERFFRKIEAIGLDPHEFFGIEERPLYQVIRDMSEARDKKAAHGSTPNRAITLGELLEYQNCARLIVLQASQFEISGQNK
jgi:hypothetical protein